MASNISLVGLLSGKMVYCQPEPVTQAASGCRCAKASTVSVASFGVMQRFKSAVCISIAPRRKWMWASLKPGVTSFPCRLKVSVEGPASFFISSEVPTAMILLSLSAMASAKGCASLLV